jgi:hypothetical protein
MWQDVISWYNVLVFQYDNILMEESAQILEIETFIPLLLQVTVFPCLFITLYMAEITLYAGIMCKLRWH